MEDEDGSGFGVQFSTLLNVDGFTSQALIEEPVASGGDSSLWTGGNAGEEDDEDDDNDNDDTDEEDPS